MDRHRLARQLIVLFGLLLGLALSVAGPAGAATAASWSEPQDITLQAPFAHHGTLTELACASASECFAGAVSPTATGAIYATADAGTSWALQRPGGAQGGGPFACAPQTASGAPFCIALGIEAVQDLTRPGAPRTGPANVVPILDGATALACPSSGLCVAAGALGRDGEIVSSTSPLTGTWTPQDVDPGHPLVAISCPDAGLCVAVDSGGGVLVSSDPGAGGWTRTVLGPGLDAVSCATRTLCVATSSSGAAYLSTSPATGSWSAANVPGASDLTGVSCPSTSFCALSDSGGAVFAADAPATGAFAQVAALGTPLGAIACPADGSCEALSGADVLVSADLSAGSGSWSIHAVDVSSPLSTVSCPTAGLCVAMGADGRAYTSTDPLSGAATWSVGVGDAFGGAPVSLSCPSVRACFGVDSSGDLLWSTDPAAGTWHTVRLDLRAATVGISCPSASFCVIVDVMGRIFTSHDPAGGAHVWHIITRDPHPVRIHSTDEESLTSVSCASVHFCLATDFRGWIYTSTDPGGSARAWRATQIWKRPSRGRYALVASACPSSRACTALGTYAGWFRESGYNPDALGTYALTSTDPAGGSRAWRSRQIDGGYVESDASTNIPGLATALSCATPGFCAMVDTLGTAVTNTVAPGRPGWLSAPIEPLASPDAGVPGTGLTGISCLSGDRCVAVDAEGQVLRFGAGAGPVVPTATLRYGG